MTHYHFHHKMFSLLSFVYVFVWEYFRWESRAEDRNKGRRRLNKKLKMKQTNKSIAVCLRHWASVLCIPLPWR